MRLRLPLVSGLHVDAAPDAERGIAHGVPGNVPVFHAAGNFGVDRALFHPADKPEPLLVVYPRGRRNYVRHQTFLEMAEEMRHRRDLRFIGVGLRGDAASEAVAARLGPARLKLTHELPRHEFARLMRIASVVVSPSLTDGTPNSVLEGLACGAFVMAGNVDTVRVLLTDGLLAVTLDANSSHLWVAALTRAIDRGHVRDSASVNPRRLAPQYDREINTIAVRRFYLDVLNRWNRKSVASASHLP